MTTSTPRHLLDVEELSLHFGGLAVLDAVTFSVADEEMVGLCGPNGSGKTSILNCVNAFYRPNSGRISIGGQPLGRRRPHTVAGLGVARTFQHVELYSGATVVENLLLGRHRHMRRGLLAGLAYWGPARAEESKHRDAVEEIVSLLELEPYRDLVVDVLPLGIQKLVEFGRALAMEPRLLLLDEPAAGMTFEERQDLARFLERVRREMRPSIVVVEHDVRFLSELCDRLVALDSGRVVATGSPRDVVSHPDVIRAYTGLDPADAKRRIHAG